MTELLWSPSQILRYRECPRRWNETRGLGSARSSGALSPYRAAGAAIHAGLAAAYQEAAQASGHRGGQVMSLFAEQALSALDHEWETLCPDLIDPSWVDQSEQENTLREHHNDAATTLVMTLSRLPIPQPSAVLAVERRVIIESETGFREQVIPDLMLRTGVESVHVRDWKRTKIQKLPRALELYRHDQLGPYALAARTLFPWARKITVGLYSTTSRREVVAEMPRDAAEHVLSGHEAVADAVERMRDFPAVRNENCFECPVRADCPVWASRETESDLV